MKEILKYSPALTPENTGEKDMGAQYIPPVPQARLDLHGLFLEEAIEETEAFLRRCRAQQYARIRIITGKGEVLQYRIPHFLREKRKQFGIFRIEENEGSIDVILREERCIERRR